MQKTNKFVIFHYKSSIQSRSTFATTQFLPTPTQPSSAFVAHRRPSGSSNSGFNSHRCKGGFVVASITTTETLIMVLDIVDTMVITTTIGSRGIGNMAVGFQALNALNTQFNLLGASFVSFVHSAPQCSQLAGHEQQANANLALSNVSMASSVDWFLDIGVNQHVTPNIANLMGSELYLGSDHLFIVGDSKKLLISYTGHTKLCTLK